MYSFIRENARKLADDKAGSVDYFMLTPHLYSQITKFKPVLDKHVHGRTLDLGAGRLAYAGIIKEKASEYVSLDITRNPKLSVVGDAQAMPFKSESFDTVFCSQILEHVPDTKKALGEIERILKSGGVAVITAPHIGYLHNEPHDYYRFTKHGLKHLVSESGLNVKSIEPVGGLVSLLGTFPSKILLTLTYGIPVVGFICFKLNKLWSKLVVAADNILDGKKIFALSNILVAEKK